VGAADYGARLPAFADSPASSLGDTRFVQSKVRWDMKPIVLATDGSPSAAEATLRAVALAKKLSAQLVVVSVEHLALPAYSYYGYEDVVRDLATIEANHVDETLAQAKAVAGEAGVACDVVHGIGPVSEQICRAARQHRAQMIVIGAHGWSPIRRVLHGSTSTAVVHEAPCPVLVVPGGPEPTADPAGPVEMDAVV